MIINKSIEAVKGLVEYSINFDGYSEEDELLEYEEFNNIKELMVALSKEKLQEIKETYHEADRIKIISISFKGTTEDKDTSFQIFLTDNEVRENVVAKIDNDDIDNRLLSNVEKIKEIIDNTLNQYPIKY